jgi:hypothetical protein
VRVAIYHLSVKTVSRSTGRSAPAAAAYRTGTLLTNERDGVTHDYRNRGGVDREHGPFIVAPEGAAWALDRAALWNAAEAAENRKNSTVAREYEVALPAELSAQGRATLARAFAQELVERYGVAADVAIHAPGGEGDQRNHHAHILTTTRTVGGGGLGPKTRALDDQRSGEIERVRELWAAMTNRALEREGVGERVTHLSHAARGLEQAPTAHLGPSATALERRGQETDRGDINRAVAGRNRAAEVVQAAEVEAKERAGRWKQNPALLAMHEREVQLLAADKAEASRTGKPLSEVRNERYLREAAASRADHAPAPVVEPPQPVRAVEPIPEPPTVPVQAEPARPLDPLEAARRMSLKELRAEIKRLEPVGVLLRPGMREADEALRVAKEAYQEADTALWQDMRRSDELLKEGQAWAEAHPIRCWLHQKGLLTNEDASRIQAEGAKVWRRIEDAKPRVAALKAALDDATAKDQALGNRYRADREREMKAIEPTLKLLRQVEHEKIHERDSLERQRDKSRDTGMEL